MAARDCSIEGRYVEFCDCDLGCPCESMAEPSKGHGTGPVAFQVDEGHCDGVSLDGTKVVATFFFPRAIHHGNGHMQPILEDTIGEEQKEAIFYIMSGEARADRMSARSDNLLGWGRCGAGASCRPD